MTTPWKSDVPGVVTLPSGRRVRGRALRAAPIPPPSFTLFLLGRHPPATAWPSRWVRWRDFLVPADRANAVDALHEVWRRAPGECVEIVCDGGRGRTGTALACLAVLDGTSPDNAVRLIRERYDRRAVETPWQRRFVQDLARTAP
ncbi:hypothetical protein ATJ97_2373 [Georgenia soli]|uniref:Tyrosine specific protein phosphatases domain-containing protein n=1 Tax=Georgenia soli TaxID=638953 RepID=A0A2A9ENM7_9MICO|nr:protein phosphatase [Georgenia soli]PFG39855.1 hypothetical protein ATJ97_2373 [Georgenia soli]